MQAECEGSRTSNELGLPPSPPSIDTGAICEAFSSLKLLERNEGGEMSSEGSDRERNGDAVKNEERVGSGDDEEGSIDNTEEGIDGDSESVENGKRDGDCDSIKTESDSNSEEKTIEETEQLAHSEEEIGEREEEIEVKVVVEYADNEKKEETMPKERVIFPISLPQRPFTPDCLAYLKTGKCSFGMACCFNHPLRKSRKVSPNGNSKEIERVGDQDKNVLAGRGKVMMVNAQYYPQREGEDCVFYLKTGRCDYGLNCCFNHPPRNPNQVTENREDQTSLDDKNGPREAYRNWAVGPSTSHIRRRPDCARYVKEGRCDYGAECRFFHHRSSRPYEFNWNPGSDWQEKPVLRTNFLGLPLRPGKDDCSEYMKHGACELSTGCQYNHPNPGPVTAKQDTHKESDKGDDTLSSLEEHAPERPKASLACIKQMLLPPERPDDSGEGYKALEVQQLSLPSLEGSRVTYKDITIRSNGLGSGRELIEYPARPGEPLCPAYIKSGACKLKSECWYDHPKDPAKPAVLLEDYNGKSSTSDANKKVIHGSIMSNGESIYPERPGAPECMYYMKHGDCKFGSTCIYHHPRHLHNKAATYSSAQASRAMSGNCYEDIKYPERPGQPECTYYMMHGDCKFQSNCIFHHPKGRNEKAITYSSFAQAPRAMSGNSLEEIKYPERPGEPECTYYMMHGDCKFRSSCKFHHPKDRNEKKISQGDFMKFVPRKS